MGSAGCSQDPRSVAPDPGHAQTRLFNAACVFVSLEELHAVWPGNPMSIMVKAIEDS